MRAQLRTTAETTQASLTERSRPRAVRWWRELILVAAFYGVHGVHGVIAGHYLADVVAGAGLWVLTDFGVRHLARKAITVHRGAVRKALLE